MKRLIILMAAVAVAACSRDIHFDENECTMTVYAELQSPTRTQIAPDQPDEFLDILWNPSDSIGVFTNSSSNSKFLNTGTEPSSNAIFKGTVPSISELQYAYYPYSNAPEVSPTCVPVTIASEQDYSDGSSIAPYDVKVSDSVWVDIDGGHHFTFHSLATILRINIARGTYKALGDNETINSITLTDLSSRPLTGNFKLNLEEMSLASAGTPASSVKVNMPNNTDNAEAYAVVYPGVKSGDRIFVEIETSAHRISYTMKASKDFEGGKYYDMTFDLGVASERAADFSSVLTVTIPHFSSFAFTAQHNPTFILDKEVYYDNSSNTTKVRNVEGAKLDIDTDGNVSGCIPYLYHFVLVPDFTLSGDAVVKVGDQVQTSGISSQDFSSPVTYTVFDTSTGASADYTVSVTNTGLPVVTLDQVTSASLASTGWNDFLGQIIPYKTDDFGTQDKFAVYNPDGTVDVARMDCGFRQRGNFSMRFPKKAMALKLSAKTKILGMPKHKRWCLLANYNDRTSLRNDVSFELARRIAETSDEGTGFDWQPSGKYVELVFNGRHVGTYYLCEQIRQDKNRINIRDSYEDVNADYNSGKSPVQPSFANCGYLLEMDDNSFSYPAEYGSEAWCFRTSYCYATSNRDHLPVVSHNDYDNTTAGQSVWTQIKNYVNTLDYHISRKDYSNASNYLDMTSAADYMLTMELTMNHEYMHPKSVYMHKDGDGKIVMGPVWDFDVWTYTSIPNISQMGRQNESYPNSYSSWMFTTEPTSKYFMWYRFLLKNSSFVSLVKQRWNAISSTPALTPESIATYIHQRSNEIALSMEYNDRMWPRTYTSPAYGYQNGDEWRSGSHTPYTFAESVELLVSAYQSRYNKMSTLTSSLTTSTINR